MAVLTIVQEPPEFQSAYKPLLVGLTSQRHPVNNMAGESANISNIRAATDTDVTTYGNGLQEGDIIVIHSTILGNFFSVGQMVRISSTINYDAQFRILKIISTTVTVIDSQDLGAETSGRIEKFYENYTLVAQVHMENAADPIRYDLSYDINDDIFYLDASDAAQRTFADVFEIAAGGEPVEFIKANRYITQQWSVNFSEAYMIPDANGINVFTELGKDGSVAALIDKIAVNSVQPYHHIDEGDGEPDLQWMDDLDEYLIDPNINDRRRFLTYAPRGGVNTYDQRTAIRAGDDDDFWLGMLNNRSENGTLNIRLIFYGADGLQDDLQDINFSVEEANSFLFNVGPAALEAYMPSTTHHYSVILRNSGGAYSETFWITRDQACEVAGRFYFFNSFGCIDQYSLENPKNRENAVKRFVTEKPNMALNLRTRRGDHQRKTYRVEVTRGYSATMRKEAKQVLRWLGDEFITSPDVRTRIYVDEEECIYTPVVLTTEEFKMGFRGGRQEVQWELGVDNKRQRR